ncbi:MAG: hypothetical protein JWO09_873 [Bacteroidetes bacterium]|nr:hypothetical protein [Bacteroidota bacterium]
MEKKANLIQKLKQWYQTRRKQTKVILWVGVFFLCFAVIDNGKTFKHKSTSNHETKICSYCGNQFSGLGYYHIGERCEQENGNGWPGTHCSAKCCDEDWAKNGINSH